MACWLHTWDNPTCPSCDRDDDRFESTAPPTEAEHTAAAQTENPPAPRRPRLARAIRISTTLGAISASGVLSLVGIWMGLRHLGGPVGFAGRLAGAAAAAVGLSTALELRSRAVAVWTSTTDLAAAARLDLIVAGTATAVFMPVSIVGGLVWAVVVVSLLGLATGVRHGLLDAPADLDEVTEIVDHRPGDHVLEGPGPVIDLNALMADDPIDRAVRPESPVLAHLRRHTVA